MSFVLVPILIEAGVSALMAEVIAFAVSTIASSIISKMFADTPNNPDQQQQLDVGNRQQIPPATNNKLPVVYGEAYVGGTVTDLSISEDNQQIYYVISICEVTNNGADTITFGDVYWGGKLVTFESDGYTVASLTDESTGIVDDTVAGKIEIFLYDNGSNNPVNSAQTAITVMNADGLTYKWDSTKLMTNTAFAVIHLSYSQTANVRGLQQTKFQVFNSRTDTGDCFYDYLTNNVYGCAIPATQIDTDSLDELTTYSNQSFTYTDYEGNTTTQPRFKFNGVIDTSQTLMKNLQGMASSCDCLLRYNEITAQWGVVVQKPTYTVAMDINNSNMVGSLSVTPIDLSNSYNVIEVQFPDNSQQDSFNTATFDLAEINPSLLFPNEPVNKQTVQLPLVNNDVTAQYLANRFIESAREDLQVQATVNFVGLQLEAGDIVTITNSNYGWSAKPFRIIKVQQNFDDKGAITVTLQMTEFNSTIYDDVNVTQFTPAPNTGIGDPTFFGVVPAPVITAQYATTPNPFFVIQITTSSSGITQYAEIWYSAFSNPTAEQRIFAGTTQVQSSGNPYDINTVMPAVSLANIPAGNWYFFSRMVNSLASSSFSPASTVSNWQPTTYQYTERYLAVAYADDASGGGFSLDPRNKEYYGLCNQSGTTAPIVASAYTWYLAEPNFGTIYYLCYSNRTGRKFSFDTGTATIAGGNGAFVPSNALLFDPSTWSALQDGENVIDLDHRTGQLTETGTTSVGDSSGELAITNNPDGKIVAQLKPFLDFGGSPTYTGSVANLTVDIYGRVVGFEPPDNFYFTKQSFTATSGQTAFTVTRASGYITDQCFVLQNGLLLDESEYTDSLTTVTLATGAVSGDIITVISFKSVNATSGVYASFTRNTVDLTNVTSYTASGFTLTSGFEFLFVNGTVLNELDYNIVDQTITDFPSNLTGKLTVIQWTPDNLEQPNGFPNNIVAFTVSGQTVYTYSYDANAFDLYSNGVLLLQGTDYTTATGTYVLSNTPDNSITVMVQQTFARTGAV